MKLKQLLTKSLLAVAMLGAGVSVWAETDDYGVDLDSYDKTTYDFTSMSGSLTIDNTADPYLAWSSRENKSVSTYPCTTTGLSKLAFQAVGGDAWQFWSTNGLGNKTRVYAAAVTGLKNGNIVVFVYLNSGKVNFGNTASKVGPYTLGDEATDSDGKYYKKATMTSDGIIGFDMNKYNGTPNAGYIRQIHIYTAKGTCADPTYEITGTNDNARTFELSCTTPESTIYYSTTELATASGGTEYTGAVETEATKIWAYAKTSSSTSGVINFNTGAGSYYPVNGATFSCAYYDVTSGKWCIKVSEDQTGVIGGPTVSLQYYTTDPSSKTDCTVGDILSGFDFSSTVHVVASADHYASTTKDYTFPPSLAVGDRVATWTDVFTSGETLTYGSAETMGNTKCAPITEIGSTTLSGNFGVYGTLSNWNSTINGLTTSSSYYTGAKNLSTTGLLKFVVNENTFMNSLISARKDVALNYTEKNADGTYSMYFDVSASHVGFNGAGGQTILSVSFMNSIPVVIPNTKEFATFNSDFALDFTDVDDITAYTAVVKSDGTSVTFTKVTGAVPANTGLLIRNTAKNGATVNVPVVASADAVTNEFVAVTSANCDSEKDYKTVTSGYVLGTKSGVQGFYKANSTDGTHIGKGKAYLPAAGAGARLSMVFEDDATGINAVHGEEIMSDGIYNLNGQRVSQPTKGLYIVNGKKVIIK